MTQKKGRGRAGDDLAQLRGQLGRGSKQTHEHSGTEDTNPEERPQGGNSSGPGGGGDEKPRRITVDLDAERHRVLREFAFAERTKGTEVLRGLLDLLRDEPEVANELRERITATSDRGD